MTPDSRLSWTLIAGLVLWSPAAVLMFHGDIDILKGGLIFVAAIMLSWIATGILSSIIQGYRDTNARVEQAKRRIEKMEERSERYSDKNNGRRRDDNDE